MSGKSCSRPRANYPRADCPRANCPRSVAIATDHGGFALKKVLLEYLKTQKIRSIDMGPSDEDSVDYPDLASLVAAAVSEGKADAGILVCGTGIGMCIAANKFKNVRAAVVNDLFSAEMAKRHNNANILCLGGRLLDEEKAVALVEIWLESPFEGERHQRRLDKIREVEEKHFR